MAEHYPVVTTPDGTRWWDVYGRLVPVIAGADPAALFPEVPDDLAALSRDELQALSTQITERAEQVTAALTGGDADARTELLGELSTRDAIEAASNALDARDRIAAELSARDEAEQADADALAALTARAAGPEDEADDGDDGDAEADDSGGDDAGEEILAESEEADEVEAEPVAVAAAAAPTAAEIAAEVIRQAGAAAQRPTRRRASTRHQPREEQSGDRATMTLTAGADIPGFALGQEITDREQIGRAFASRMRTIGKASALADGERVPVLRRTVTLPDDRQLGGDAAHNTERMDAILGRQALVAAGGICAPPEPMYDVPSYFVADTPVRAALPAMQAPRGGITYMQPITIASGIGADMADASDFWTLQNDEDAADDPQVRKDCLRIECGDFVTADIEAIYQCITVGNLDARTFPERIAALVDAADAARARKAEGRFLDAIKTASTTVSHGVGFGAFIDIVAAFAQARAGMISRHRMSPDQRFHALLPAWLAEALPVDQIRRKGDPDMVRATVTAALERYGVSVTWYIDTPSTGTSQLFASQAASTLRDFPATAQIGFYPEGSFGYLDLGELDLGLVRDSTLNASNDYQLFSEEFVKVFYRGVEALWINAALCYSGQTQIAGSILDCAYNVTTDTDGS